MASVAPLARSQRVLTCGCKGVVVALRQAYGAMRARPRQKPAPCPAHSSKQRPMSLAPELLRMTYAITIARGRCGIVSHRKRRRDCDLISHPSIQHPTCVHTTRCYRYRYLPLLPSRHTPRRCDKLRHTSCGFPADFKKRGNTVTTPTTCSMCGHPTTCHPGKLLKPSLRPPNLVT